MNNQRETLLIAIDIDELLFRSFCQSIFTSQQIENIKNGHSVKMRNGQLLKLLISTSTEHQNIFLQELDKMECQKHVANFIRSDGKRTAKFGDNWPLVACEQMRYFEKHWPEVIEEIDITDDLIAKLCKIKLLSFRQAGLIEFERKRPDKNTILLSILRHRSLEHYLKFTSLLVDVNQRHAANLLSPDMVRSVHPIEYRVKDRLLLHREALVRLIETEELLDQMFAKGCITMHERFAIESSDTPKQRNERLLDIVTRGSQSTYEVFIECLNAAGQQHVCHILNENVAIVPVVCKLGSKDDNEMNVQQVEGCIVQLFARLSAERRDQLLKQMLTRYQHPVEIISVHHGSIQVFFLCRNFASIREIYDKYCSTELKHDLTWLFSSLHEDILVGGSIRVETLSWDFVNYNHYSHFFTTSTIPVFSEIYRLAGRSTSVNYDHDVGNFDMIEMLPFELIEMIVIRSTGYLFKALSKYVTEAEVYALATLMGVSQLWWKTLTYRLYIKRLLRTSFKHFNRPFGSRSPRHISSINVDGNQSVHGVAVLNDTLYVTCSKSDCIQVFTGFPFERKKDLVVPGLSFPSDVSICSLNNQLFVADCDMQCVWRVNLSSPWEVDRFIRTHNYKPYKLSLNSQHLLVTPASKSFLYVYDLCGTLKHLVTLPAYMLVLDAVETPVHTYIVCHVSNTDKKSSYRNGITEVDVTGNIIRNENLNENLTKVCRPHYLVLDSRHNIFVADRFSKRIIMLQSDLQVKRVVITSLRGQPNRIVSNLSSRLLYVSYWDSTTIDVFRW